jgi:hypothetical protein
LLNPGFSPLHLIDAPTQGSGKTLLAKLISMVATGTAIPSMTEATSGDEWRKKITATLLNAPSVIFLDNLSKKQTSLL